MAAAEILAGIFAVLILIKIIGIFVVGPLQWMKMAEKVHQHKARVSVIILILVIVVGYFLLSTLSATSLMAVLLFASLLLGMGLLPYSLALLTTGKNILKTRKDLLKNFWFVLLVWLFLALWVLYTLFRKL